MPAHCRGAARNRRPPHCADLPHSLPGLWGAEVSFGLEARGPLADRTPWLVLDASIIGVTVPIQTEGSELRFHLPGGRGDFRGRVADDAQSIRGQWIQPPAAHVWGSSYATPIELNLAGNGVCRGRVEPLEDAESIYLMIGRDSVGNATAFSFANPRAQPRSLSRGPCRSVAGRTPSSSFAVSEVKTPPFMQATIVNRASFRFTCRPNWARSTSRGDTAMKHRGSSRTPDTQHMRIVSRCDVTTAGRRHRCSPDVGHRFGADRGIGASVRRTTDRNGERADTCRLSCWRATGSSCSKSTSTGFTAIACTIRALRPRHSPPHRRDCHGVGDITTLDTRVASLFRRYGTPRNDDPRKKPAHGSSTLTMTSGLDARTMITYRLPRHGEPIGQRRTTTGTGPP